MLHPNINCSSPRDSSGLAGSGLWPAADEAPFRREATGEREAGRGCRKPELDQRSRRGGGRGGGLEAAAAAPAEQRLPTSGTAESRAMGQQEPGTTTGRDIGRGGGESANSERFPGWPPPAEAAGQAQVPSTRSLPAVHSLLLLRSRAREAGGCGRPLFASRSLGLCWQF